MNKIKFIYILKFYYFFGEWYYLLAYLFYLPVVFENFSKYMKKKYYLNQINIIIKSKCKNNNNVALREKFA